MDDLQSLVRHRLQHLRKEHRVTAAQAVRSAVEAGYRITEARLSQLKRMRPGERMGLPHHEVLAGIAAALDLPDGEVIDAALRSSGHVIPVRRYPYDRSTTEGPLCVDCPTQSSGFDELVMVLPRPDLTAEEIARLIRAFDQAAARLLERRSPSE